MRFATIPTKFGPFLCPEPLANQNTSLFPISKLTELPHPPLQPDFIFDPDLQAFFAGRLLLLDEIPFSFQTIQAHYLHGFIQYEKGITKEDHGLSCQRCGNKDKEFCRQCGRVFSLFPEKYRQNDLCSDCKEEKVLGKQLVEINKLIQPYLGEQLQEIKAQLIKIRTKRTNNTKYANPYQWNSADGMFFDKRK